MADKDKPKKGELSHKQKQRQENDTHEVGERAASGLRRESRTKGAAIKGRANAAQAEGKKRKK
jgi:hypothetical protein